MAWTSKKIYTEKLRKIAVKLVSEGELIIPEVGKRLSIPPSTLRYWVKKCSKTRCS